MAIIKPFKSSHQFQLLSALRARKEFSSEEKQYFHSLQKGHEGEKKWQAYLQGLPPEIPILYDITLNVNHTTFQVDALIIYEHHITFFEIKNYSGNYTIQDGHWFHSSTSDKEIKNPFIQLERNETLIRQFFNHHQLQLTFDYLLIFINPEFMLYDATPRKNLILPPQIPSLIRKLKQIRHIPTSQHTKIIQSLLSHQTDHPLFFVPEYTYHDVAKGFFCKKCTVKMDRLANRLICSSCMTVYSFETALLQLIEEFSILFPSMRITNQVIYEWCAGTISKATIRRVLGKNYSLIGNGRGTHYEKINTRVNVDQ